MSKAIIRLYYYEETGNGEDMDWVLTSDLKRAEWKVNFRNATLDDVERNGYLGQYYDDKILHIEDGFLEWNNDEEEYTFVEDVKDVVLSRMEDMEFENSKLYEDIVGMKKYKVENWMDKNMYDLVLG